MKKPPFLHDDKEFKDLIEITAQAENIQDPALVEKDYWLMHVLWGLKSRGFEFHLKGGTSLSKGIKCIHRFSEDIDIKIEPDEKATGFKVSHGVNQDSAKQRDSRKNFFDWIADQLKGKIPGLGSVKRDKDFDDEPRYRSAGIRLFYPTLFGIPAGMKEGILLEVGFDRTAPNQPYDISSWAYDLAAKAKSGAFLDNRALGVLCYDPKFTFVEKLQAVTKKFRQYKAGKEGASLPANFIRHYYDLFQLLERNDVQAYIGTADYEAYKKERFGTDDTKISNGDALKLSNERDRALFEKEYGRTESLYFRGRPTLGEILRQFAEYLERL